MSGLATSSGPDDLVERLRRIAPDLPQYRPYAMEAAAEIERLRAENARLKEWQVALTQDAERYRFMRSPLAAEYGIVQGEFWEELSFKLCREEKMDELVDGAMKLLKRHIDAARAGSKP